MTSAVVLSAEGWSLPGLLDQVMLDMNVYHSPGFNPDILRELVKRLSSSDAMTNTCHGTNDSV